MKKNRLLTSLLFALCITVGLQYMSYAQGGRPRQGFQNKSPEERASLQVQMLSKQLNLSADQEKQLTPLMLERVQKRDALRTASDKKAALLEMQALNQAQEGQIKSILSPEQYEQYKALQEKMKDRMMDRARERFNNE